ncbi:MAG: hypothetical protein EBX61_00465, partial [Betaproteobacteria bacterium]|nr:hypothetical protein [Betaproteobacteria bacterium]
TNKAITSVAKSMDGLKFAGASAFNIFGNLAERQKRLMEMFENSGPALRTYTNEIIRGRGAVLGFINGLGATDAQVASVEKQIGAMMRATGIADDNLRPAFANNAPIA